MGDASWLLRYYYYRTDDCVAADAAAGGSARMDFHGGAGEREKKAGASIFNSDVSAIGIEDESRKPRHTPLTS